MRRILDLELAYPGLQRISLAHNYRCPPDVVEASRRLIEHNDIRFPKKIQAKSGPTGGLALRLCTHETQPDGADEIAALLAGRTRGEIVVLARTTNLLRTVALRCSCADPNPACGGPRDLAAPAPDSAAGKTKRRVRA